MECPRRRCCPEVHPVSAALPERLVLLDQALRLGARARLTGQGGGGLGTAELRALRDEAGPVKAGAALPLLASLLSAGRRVLVLQDSHASARLVQERLGGDRLRASDSPARVARALERFRSGPALLLAAEGGLGRVPPLAPDDLVVVDLPVRSRDLRALGAVRGPATAVRLLALDGTVEPVVAASLCSDLRQREWLDALASRILAAG